MAVSRIIEFKQNSQEARKKKHDMVGNTAFPPFNGHSNDSCVPFSVVQCRLFLSVTAESRLQLLALKICQTKS